MLLSLFWTFFQIGLFTFGGGYAMIANIQEVVVEKRRWLDDEELTQVIAVAESTPGPIAINLATYVGYKKGGFWGSVFATLGVVLPSLVILYTISLFLDAVLANRYVAYAFIGIQCAVAFLILRAGLTMLAKLERRVLPLVVFAAVFLLAFFGASSLLLILCGGLLGILLAAGKGEKK